MANSDHHRGWRKRCDTSALRIDYIFALLNNTKLEDGKRLVLCPVAAPGSRLRKVITSASSVVVSECRQRSTPSMHETLRNDNRCRKHIPA
jgi:hypothetical protein